MSVSQNPPVIASSRPGREAALTCRDGGRLKGQRRRIPKLPRNLVRGQGYLTAHGLGYYVGTSTHGRHCFCYGRLDELHAMCARFDARYGKHVPAASRGKNPSP